MEGGGGSTIPAACLQPLQTATAVIASDSITLLPTVDIQARPKAHLHGRLGLALVFQCLQLYWTVAYAML